MGDNEENLLNDMLEDIRDLLDDEGKAARKMRNLRQLFEQWNRRKQGLIDG